jgi:hypothetical protein
MLSFSVFCRRNSHPAMTPPAFSRSAGSETWIASILLSLLVFAEPPQTGAGSQAVAEGLLAQLPHF